MELEAGGKNTLILHNSVLYIFSYLGAKVVVHC